MLAPLEFRLSLRVLTDERRLPVLPPPLALLAMKIDGRTGDRDNTGDRETGELAKGERP